jgi:hypothetical protein
MIAYTRQEREPWDHVSGVYSRTAVSSLAWTRAMEAESIISNTSKNRAQRLWMRVPGSSEGENSYF